jgi:transposase-like protein
MKTNLKKQKKENNNMIKRGFCKGVQVWYNKETGKHSLETYKERGAPQLVKDQALFLFLEGNSFRSIGRFLKYSHVTIMNWVYEAYDKIKDLSLFHNVSGEETVVIADEMWHFSQKKSPKNGCGWECAKEQVRLSLTISEDEGLRLLESFGKSSKKQQQ